MNSAHANPAFLLLQSATAEALDRVRRAESGDADVHAARKALKQARAALRLLRPLLGDAAWRSHNAELRDAARCLAPVRDAKTMLETIDALAQQHEADGHAAAIAGFRQALGHRLAAAREELAQTNVRRHCAGLIETARAGIGRKLPLAGDAMLRDALEAIYRKARKAFLRTSAADTVAARHEWRKQTKYLRDAQAVFDPADRRALKESRRRAKRISDWLGEEHDLAVLGELLAGRGSSSGATGHVLAAQIEERRTRLQSKALRKGEKLFSAKPRRYVARVLGKRARDAARRR